MKNLETETILQIIQNHKRIIIKNSDYDLTDEQEYNRHSKLISGLAKNYLRREFRDFVFDEHNRQIFRFLAYYFNGCELAESVFPNENYKINKNLLLIGRVGTGKTLTMQIFADYLKFTQNKNQFLNVSQTQMMNYQKIHGHIDFFTFNEINSKKFEGNPYNICLNDIGLETEAQKSYGTSLDTVIDEFLYARYEIYQQQNIKYHLTSNLNVDDFKKRFGNRLIDRFKSFNILIFDGASRRM